MSGAQSLPGRLGLCLIDAGGACPRNSPDEPGASVFPRERPLHHDDAPQRPWFRKPVPSATRAPCVPRDPRCAGCRFWWGDPLPPGSSGLYVHFIRTSPGCQAPAIGRERRTSARQGVIRVAAPHHSSVWHRMCLPSRIRRRACDSCHSGGFWDHWSFRNFAIAGPPCYCAYGVAAAVSGSWSVGCCIVPWGGAINPGRRDGGCADHRARGRRPRPRGGETGTAGRASCSYGGHCLPAMEHGDRARCERLPDATVSRAP